MKQKETRLTEMQARYIRAVQYFGSGNYIGAKEEAELVQRYTIEVGNGDLRAKVAQLLVNIEKKQNREI